jgi:hypothetical protein
MIVVSEKKVVLLLEKCRVQFLNVYTQEILRDELMKKEIAEEMIKMMVHPQSVKLRDESSYLMDSKMRLFKAKYITYKESIEDGIKVYRVMFQVKLNEKQMPVKRK